MYLNDLNRLRKILRTTVSQINVKFNVDSGSHRFYICDGIVNNTQLPCSRQYEDIVCHFTTLENTKKVMIVFRVRLHATS